ncbi:MAG: hypothetical protein IAF38_22575, partial [Bacteroidia bacterium]|nr:hypothetical protein [Bacteroidia bacterium]
GMEIDKGMNYFVWDMYYADVEKIEGMILWSGIGQGPKAAPGNYYVQVRADKDSVEKEFEIKANPVYNISQQDYDEQLNFLLTVSGLYNEVQKSIIKIRDLRKQIGDFTGKQGKDCPKEIKTQSDSITKQLTRVEEALYQTKLKSGQDVLNFPMKLNNKIANLYDYASSGNNAPTKQVKDAFNELSILANEQLNILKKIIETDVSKLNEMITAKALPVIVLKKEQ